MGRVFNLIFHNTFEGLWKEKKQKDYSLELRKRSQSNTINFGGGVVFMLNADTIGKIPGFLPIFFNVSKHLLFRKRFWIWCSGPAMLESRGLGDAGERFVYLQGHQTQLDCAP